MRGSLAIWCDVAKEKIDGHTPEIELHFNIWQDLPKNEDGLIDIGIRFIEARTIESLFLYIPGTIEPSDIIDLFDKMRSDKALSAIFNDTLTLSDNSDDFFEAEKDGKTHLRILKIKQNEKSIRKIEEKTRSDEKSTGSVIKFSKSLFERMNKVGDHYIRIRIPLKGNLKEIFITENFPNDHIFLSSFYKSDLIEFRINERRNYGPNLIRNYKLMDPPKIRAVHYFLIRDLKSDFVRSHAEFRKMRRLEPLLWEEYLQELGVNADNMIIYHWRDVAKANSTVDDFIAFALFRTAKYNIMYFIIFILVAGAIGSGIFSIFSEIINETIWKISQGGEWKILQGGEIIALLCLIAILLVMIDPPKKVGTSAAQLLKRLRRNADA